MMTLLAWAWLRKEELGGATGRTGKSSPQEQNLAGGRQSLRPKNREMN
jgi:hypothetical protein